jgi:hypothetical protein
MASDADLLRCRSIPDVAKRVTCYDAIPVASAAAAASAPLPVTQAAPVLAAAPVVAAAPVAPASAANPTANFGLSATQMRKSDEPNFIESSLLGRIDGWSPSTQFRLANGQIWRVADDSVGSVNEVENPKVKISRNSLGSLFLEIEGTTQAPRVRRVQ